MKRVHMMLLAVFFSFVCIAEASAGNKAVNGLLIGAGSGAIIGQAAGQNTESVLIGTAIGGAVGYAIGNSMENPRRVIHYSDSSRSVVYGYNDHRYKDYRYKDYRSHEYRHLENHRGKYYDRHPNHYRSKHYSPHYDYPRRGSDCKKTVIYKKNKHKVTRIVKNTCDKPYYYNRDRGRSRW